MQSSIIVFCRLKTPASVEITRFKQLILSKLNQALSRNLIQLKQDIEALLYV